MSTSEPLFQEAKFGKTPIRELGLTIAGTPLEKILGDFQTELEAAGIRRLKPSFYLSTEWGVPFGSISIAIPFYLARADLTALQRRRYGFVEGVNRQDILRFLRHEMGHVVNYAYRLYEQEEWVKQFGSMTQPYEEDYRPEPFSRRFVHHLAGWYAQKHPDEDWSETFAVWLTPASEWRIEYAAWPVALAKLKYCDDTMKALADRDPGPVEVDLDEDVGEIGQTLEQFYAKPALTTEPLPPGLDGALRTIFNDLVDGEPEGRSGALVPAGALFRQLSHDLSANLFRWTGLFPERSLTLLAQLAERADQLEQRYRADRETEAILGITTLVTALAMNYVHRGSYMPVDTTPAQA